MKSTGEDFSLIDVREPEEWKKGTISGAATIARGVRVEYRSSETR